MQHDLANHCKDIRFVCQSAASSCDFSRHSCLCFFYFQFHLITFSLQIVTLLFQRILWCRLPGKDLGRLARWVKIAKQLAMRCFSSVFFFLFHLMLSPVQSLKEVFVGFTIKTGIVIQLYSLKSL